MQIKKYRKLPVVIEAMRLPEEGQVDIQAVQNFTGDRMAWTMGDGTIVVISTLEGNMQGNPGDYIIKGVNGECYPCKPDIFDKTYEDA